MQHYLEYRSTHDVDAWWAAGRDDAALAAARSIFRETAQTFGWEFRERSWGETVSLEAWEGSRKAFSFQVAERSVELTPPRLGVWGNLAIESIEDNVGAKMNALVSRGAPRDFVDIKAIVDAGIVSEDGCWALWQRKNPSATIAFGKMAVQNNLAALMARVPLERISEGRRDAARALRTWFREVFAAP